MKTAWRFGLALAGILTLSACRQDDADAAPAAKPLGISLLTYPNGHSLTYRNEDPAIALEEGMLIDLVNQYRITKGLNALTPDPDLSEIARGHCYHMSSAEHGFVQHVSPEGYGPGDRLSQAGIAGYFGETLAAGQVDVLSTLVAWINSPEHRECLEDPEFDHLGVGICREESHYRSYYTALFLRRR